MDFATNFKRICTEKNTSPTRVCSELGLSSSKVNLWNNGSLPKQDMLVRLAQHLDCSVMDFFADEQHLLHTSDSSNELDADEREVIRLFRTLSLKEKHKFMAQAYVYEEETLHNK